MQIIIRHPKRFVGLGNVPMQDPSLAAAEMRRCVQEYNFSGVQIGSHINNWNLDAPELLPFWKVQKKTKNYSEQFVKATLK